MFMRANNNDAKQSTRSPFNYAQHIQCMRATVERQTAASLGDGMSAHPNDVLRVRASVYTHIRVQIRVRELHVSDKHTSRRCLLWNGTSPPGNNSKSRVINPSAVSFFPTPLRPSVCPLVRWVYTPVRVDACAWPSPLHLFIPFYSFPASSSLMRARTYAHARRWVCNFYPLLFEMGYTCMMYIVVNCSHATAVYLLS